MTNKELIKRLLDEETDLADCAADRIEELMKEIERRIEPEQVEKLVMLADPIMSEIYSVECLCRQDAEAKLAKAVEALRFYTHDYVFSGSKARAVLAELEAKE